VAALGELVEVDEIAVGALGPTPRSLGYESLSPREREVMALVVSGLLNKQVGAELGISETTVKAPRGQVMRKMKADSAAPRNLIENSKFRWLRVAVAAGDQRRASL
jgi:DNA-binding NarL/FixJ family response regulator